MPEKRLERTRKAYCTCFPWDGIHAVDCELTNPKEKPKITDSPKEDKNGSGK